MHGLRLCVHAPVGAASPGHFDLWDVEDDRQGLLDLGLHRRTILLAGKAEVGRPVIGEVNTEANGWHGDAP